MNCPLCTEPMRFHYRTINRPPENHTTGYTDVLSCSKCNCTVDLIVRDSEELHNVISGEAYRRAMGEA